MKINEIEKLLGITKYTLRYYEKEDLIHPIKDDNGYRNYSDEDIQVLQLVIFLRSLNISIDDIKGILSGKLTFKECLTVNKIYLDQKVEELSRIQNTVNEYVDKDIPLIPALTQIQSVITEPGLGYRKTNKEITLGKKPSKKSVTLKFLIAALFTFNLIYIWINIVCILTSNIFYIIILAVIPTLVLHYLLFGSSLHMTTIENSQEQSIEFLNDGIRYYQRNNVFEHALYMYSYLFNNQNKYLKFVKYSDIINVTLKETKRYIRFGSPISTQVDAIDFMFEFKNGEHFYFYWPSTYNNDMKFIMTILTELIINVTDDQNIIEK